MECRMSVKLAKSEAAILVLPSTRPPCKNTTSRSESKNPGLKNYFLIFRCAFRSVPANSVPDGRRHSSRTAHGGQRPGLEKVPRRSADQCVSMPLLKFEAGGRSRQP